MSLLYILSLCHTVFIAVNTFEIKKQCGEPFAVSLEHDGLPRKSLMYIPKTLCNDQQSPTTNPLTLPILVTMHCYGGEAGLRMANWRSFAEEFNFIIVAPNGLQSSWNADQCCGYALEQNIDDIGFIQRIINETIKTFPTVFPSVTLSDGNGEGYIWISGFSNGGFMADKIAWQSSVGQFSKIIAAAPNAGYIYDRSRYIQQSASKSSKPKPSEPSKSGSKQHSTDNTPHRAVAMYFHHSATDTFVRPDGCCNNKSPKCCCGISEASNHCLSVYQEFEQWIKWNNCKNGLGFDSLKRKEMIEDKQRGKSSKSVKVTCADATPQDHGCERRTSLCIHENTVHSQWARDMPQTREVMLFFMESLCLAQNGKFDRSKKKCQCAEGSEFDGPFCISGGVGDGIWWYKSGYIHVTVVIGIAVVLLVANKNGFKRSNLRLML